MSHAERLREAEKALVEAALAHESALLMALKTFDTGPASDSERALLRCAAEVRRLRALTCEACKGEGWGDWHSVESPPGGSGITRSYCESCHGTGSKENANG